MAASPRKAVLTISLSRHLTGHPIAAVIDKDWTAKATPEQRDVFDSQGFDLDPGDGEVGGGLVALQETLRGRDWDGVIVGWCTRGNKEFTVLFERVVGACVAEVVRRAKLGGEGPKMMFCDGPEDLVRTTLRGLGA